MKILNNIDSKSFYGIAVQEKEKDEINQARSTVANVQDANGKDIIEQIVQAKEKDEIDEARSTVANVQDANVVVEKIVIRSLYINVEGAIREMYHTK